MNAFQRIYRGETDVDFIGRRAIWFGISGLILLVCIGSLVLKGFNYGIEFAGGISVQAPVDEGTVSGASDTEVTERTREALRPLGAANAQIQVFSEGAERSVVVQTGEIGDAEGQQEIRSVVSETVGASVEDTTFQSVGRRWGQEITDKAVRALIIFLLVILAYMAWQFEWKMGVAAIVALGHDLLITAGLYSLVGFEVTPSTVIAILTILGYSLYDTVVVFDKVEEETTLYSSTGRMTYQDSANLAMNRVFARSINTSLTTLIPIAALLFVGAGLAGAETLKDLALALFVGILAGTYSSVFVATPVLSVMKEHEPRYKNVREKVLRDARRSGARSDDGKPGKPSREPVPAGASPASGSRATSQQGQRPKAGTRKAKRRKKR